MSVSEAKCEQFKSDLRHVDALLEKLRDQVRNLETPPIEKIDEAAGCLIRQMDEARAQLNTLKEAGLGTGEDLSRTLDRLTADLKKIADSVLSEDSLKTTPGQPRGMIEAVNSNVEIERDETDALTENTSATSEVRPTTMEFVCGGREVPKCNSEQER